MDTKRIESLVYQLLEALGENPDREGLVETPKRVAQMMEEMFEGIQYTMQTLRICLVKPLTSIQTKW